MAPLTPCIATQLIAMATVQRSAGHEAQSLRNQRHPRELMRLRLMLKLPIPCSNLPAAVYGGSWGSWLEMLAF